jgi:hypothetical protein
MPAALCKPGLSTPSRSAPPSTHSTDHCTHEHPSPPGCFLRLPRPTPLAPLPPAPTSPPRHANSQVPLIEHFFGVVPHAARRQIVLQPRFPAAWAHAELHELRVGLTTISVEWESGDATERLRLHCAHRSWVVHVLLDHTCKHVSVDGVRVHAPPVSFSASDVLRAEMSGRLVPVRFSCSGCAVVVVCEHEARGPQ